MTDLRSQLLDILTQLLGSTSVEDVLITRIRPLGSNRDGLEFISNAPRPVPRRLVATLRDGEEQEESDGEETSHAAEETSNEHDETGHSEPKPHAAPANPNAHAKPSNSKSSHSKPQKSSSKSGAHSSQGGKH